jgi:hypothetical protein
MKWKEILRKTQIIPLKYYLSICLYRTNTKNFDISHNIRSGGVSLSIQKY